MKTKFLWSPILVLFLIIVTASGTIIAQTPTATISGRIFTGSRLPDGKPNTATAVPLTNASVMVQNMHSGGAFVTYGTVGIATGSGFDANTWTAEVPAPGEYVVMISALGHDATSREFIVTAEGQELVQDAYLPPLPLPTANLLAYAFNDKYVNGESDALSEDPPLKGVTLTVMDEDGAVLATGVTGAQPLTDLPPGTEAEEAEGLYYFTGLPPGELFVSADPTTVPTYNSDPSLGSDWYHMTSEEGSQNWEIVLYPGDPGTEDGSFLVWFGFVEKIGQIGSPTNPTPYNPNLVGKITGWLTDADTAFDPFEPGESLVPQAHPGVTANTTVPSGFVVLSTDGETIKTRVAATVEADPETGYFEFVNVPPGGYKLFLSDVPIDYVYVKTKAWVAPGQTVALSPFSTLLPRFFARAQGYVYDHSTNPPTPMGGTAVHMRYKDGSIQQTTMTDDNGWYNFDDLPEIEVMGYVDVEPPPGYRGAMVTDTFYPNLTYVPTCNPNLPDPPCITLGDPYHVTHNGLNRYIQWYTANYRADLYLEPIPGNSGHIDGFVFNDHLERGAWVGDGAYQKGEERTLPGVTVELWDAAQTTLLATTTTGKFDNAATLAQGWNEPYTFPVDEWGGVYVGPLPGYFEFRDLPPGNYSVKVVPPDGFNPSPSASDVVALTVTGGDGMEVNFGLNTLVPLAGEIEGGVFDDINIDANPLSLLYAEKAGIPGAPIGVYDHLGYLLGVGHMGNPLCYAGSTVCPQGEAPGQKPEMERRLAPGVHLFYANDPAFSTYNPNYLPLMLPYTFGQGKYKFEADWSLIPNGFGGLGAALLGNAQILPDDGPEIEDVIPEGSYMITGTNFGAEQGYSTISLSGQMLPVLSWSDTEIHVKDLPDIVSGPIIVTTLKGPSNAVHVDVDYNRGRAKKMAKRSVYVDINNLGFEDGSQAHPWRTIAAALENLPSATPRYVFVAPGTYYERIQIIESDINFIGSGPRETIINGRPDPISITDEGFSTGGGPVIFIGAGGETGSVTEIMISSFTITGGTVSDDIGGGIFGDYGNENIDINNSIIVRNGGYYGGGIWLHRSNHNVEIWSNTIAENGNYGGYGGGISVNDEPEYGPEHGQPEHVVDDPCPPTCTPPGEYHIFNNHIFRNYSPDYGGGFTLYEVKDHLIIYGNLIEENKADDHGGGAFFEDTGPIDLYGNKFIRNICFDDGGAISFEDVGDDISTVLVYNNLFAENIADDHGENRARGGALAFDDTFYAEVFNNTIVGNVVAGSFDPAGGGIDSERHGHEYNGTDAPYITPGYSDVKIYNNIVWDNWRLNYDQPAHIDEEDLDYTWGVNYRWTPDNLHVDNPALQEERDSQNNSESFTDVEYNNISNGEYNGRPGNISIAPLFVDPGIFTFTDGNGTPFLDPGSDWRLTPGSPMIDQAPVGAAPKKDLDTHTRKSHRGYVDLGAYEFLDQGILDFDGGSSIFNAVKGADDLEIAD